MELGMFLDAVDELEAISKNVSSESPEVLAMWVSVYHGLEKWKAMQAVAIKLAKIDPENVQWPISWAFATRRSESIEAAKEILLDALDRHPMEALVYYNLACYDCQLGEVTSSKELLDRALEISPGFLLMALEDPDLEPFRPELLEKKKTDSQASDPTMPGS